MNSDNARTAQRQIQLQELLSSPVYKENLDFWERAWAPLKTPYTQMPDLPYLNAIPDYLTQRGASKVLDLGCGSGWLSIYLGRAGFAVTGVDVAAQALQLARTWAADEHLEITFDLADIAELPYKPGCFDAIVANSIFEHFTYDLAAHTLKRLRELLKQGGAFIGCFDKVGGGPGEYYELSDGTHVYIDKGRSGMLLRCFSSDELRQLFDGWSIDAFEELESGSRFVCAHLPQ